MIIDCIADLHGFYPKLPGGDLLIVAGDMTSSDKIPQWKEFYDWLMAQEYLKKVYIGGNHDNFLKSCVSLGDPQYRWLKHLQENPVDDFEGIYLCDSGTEFEGLKIWGTPWTPIFDGVNPECKAFMADDEFFLDQKFALIPRDIDILITHGPMRHMLDANEDGYACGSRSLKSHIDRAKPKFHIFGHIHEQGGQDMMYDHGYCNTWCVNCSHVNEKYKPVHKHMRIKYEA